MLHHILYFKVGYITSCNIGNKFLSRSYVCTLLPMYTTHCRPINNFHNKSIFVSALELNYPKLYNHDEYLLSTDLGCCRACSVYHTIIIWLRANE